MRVHGAVIQLSLVYVMTIRDLRPDTEIEPVVGAPVRGAHAG
jgi:hypothetical protein